MNDEDIKSQKNLKQIDFGYVCKQKCLYNMAQLIQCNFLINLNCFGDRFILDCLQGMLYSI